MKSFTASLLGSCLGVIVSFALFFVIIIIIAVSGSESSGPSLGKNTILHLNLDDFIPEQTDNAVQELSLMEELPDNIGLARVCELIEHAGKDSKIEGIILENSNVSIGQASLLSLIESLEKFKESKKFIYSYADSHSQSSYMLCTVADSMYLNPYGSIDIRGFGTMIPFVKNMLDKIGVKMNVFYAGDFKSATEPFRLTEMSEANKLQTREFLRDMRAIFVDIVSKNRSVSPEKLDTIIANFEGRTANKALKHGLVDVLAYKEEFYDAMKNKTKTEIDKKLKTISLSDYHLITSVDKPESDDKIAVIYLEGEIGYGTDEPGTISDKRYAETLEKIKNDKNIKAVVLRINSPGGSAFSSEIIWKGIEDIKASGKKVVASFGDVAASGGYYIAAGANKIFAQPNTLTGSIGVFSILPDATALANEKLGINFDSVKTDPLAIGFTPFMNLSAREMEVLQESTLEIYDLFLTRVSKGRKLSMDSTKVIAQGRVWTGRKAKEIGLVDELGDLEKAIAAAAQLAKIEKYEVDEYPKLKPDFLTEIIKGIQRNQQMGIYGLLKTPEEKKLYEQIRQMRAILNPKQIQARLPYMIDFNG